MAWAWWWLASLGKILAQNQQSHTANAGSTTMLGRDESVIELAPLYPLSTDL